MSKSICKAFVKWFVNNVRRSKISWREVLQSFPLISSSFLLTWSMCNIKYLVVTNAALQNVQHCCCCDGALDWPITRGCLWVNNVDLVGFFLAHKGWTATGNNVACQILNFFFFSRKSIFHPYILVSWNIFFQKLPILLISHHYILPMTASAICLSASNREPIRATSSVE